MFLYFNLCLLKKKKTNAFLVTNAEFEDLGPQAPAFLLNCVYDCNSYTCTVYTLIVCKLYDMLQTDDTFENTKLYRTKLVVIGIF